MLNALYFALAHLPVNFGHMTVIYKVVSLDHLNQLKKILRLHPPLPQEPESVADLRHFLKV